MTDERREHVVERRRQFLLHHQTVEQPSDRTELDPVFQVLRDARGAAVWLDSGDPPHEMNGPVALGDLEPNGPPVFPLDYAFDHASFRNEVAGSSGADARS